MTRSDRFPLLPRAAKADKRCFGHVLVLAGSRRMPGAARLVCKGALAGGAGLVTLAGPRGMLDLVAGNPPEIMWAPLPETHEGAVSDAALGKLRILSRSGRYNVLAAGPGLTVERGTARVVRDAVIRWEGAVVLDADGLNSFKGRARLLKRARGSLVLTPHKGEFERLFQERLPEGGPRRAALAKKLARSYDVVLVLKGHRTLVVSADRCYENRTGNAGMAKGGCGDALTGILAAFIAQGLEPFEAARWAVYFHGAAGDLAVRRAGQLGLTASDLLGSLPRALAARR